MKAFSVSTAVVTAKRGKAKRCWKCEFFSISSTWKRLWNCVASSWATFTPRARELKKSDDLPFILHGYVQVIALTNIAATNYDDILMRGVSHVLRAVCDSLFGDSG